MHDHNMLVKFSFSSWRIYVEDFFLSFPCFYCEVNYLQQIFNKSYEFDKVSRLHFKGKQVLSRLHVILKSGSCLYCYVYCLVTEWLYIYKCSVLRMQYLDTSDVQIVKPNKRRPFVREKHETFCRRAYARNVRLYYPYRRTRVHQPNLYIDLWLYLCSQ